MKNWILFAGLFSFTSHAQQFTEVSQSVGIDHEHIDEHIMGGGAAFFDFDADGYEDLYVTGGNNRDQLFINDQDGTFTEVGAFAGMAMTDTIKTVGVITGDLDNDGYREIFVTTSENHRNLLFHNNGDGTFTEIGISAGFTDSTWSMSASFGDYNKDGLLDLYVGEYVNYFNVPFYNFMNSGTMNKLYINQGNLTFVESALAANVNDIGGALATTFTDYDFDNDVDILLGNDFGILFGGNALFRNNYPTDDFTNISVSAGMYQEINAMGIAIGDFDEDQDLDYYITNMMENLFHENNNDQTFNEIAATSNTEIGGVVSWGTFFFDYDNDTYLDLFSASGGVMTMANPQQNVLFENQQNGTFSDVTAAQGLDSIRRSRGAIYGDYNNDGALDIVVVNVDDDGNFPEPTKVYENSSSNNWFKIKLEGTTSNRDAFGSRVRIVSGGRSFIREIGGGSSYLSQNSSIAHFGLGSVTTVDSVLVTWPTGVTETYAGFPSNFNLTVVEGTAGLQETKDQGLMIYPNPAKETLYCSTSSGEINEIRLIDSQGAIIYQSNNDSSTSVKIDVKDVPGGLYQLEIRSGNEYTVRKVVIE